MRTYTPKQSEIERDWYVVDATDRVVGRLATEIARRLRGKHKPQFSPHMDTGDFVVVVNAERVRLTGNKLDEKQYSRHSGRPGSLRQLTARQVLEQHPERVIRQAVWGMLPKNRLGRRLIKKLKIYTGPDHPHEAQRPQALEV